MANITVDTSQLNAFVVEIDKAGSSFEKGVKQTVSKSAMQIKRSAMQNLTKNKSVKTGNLRRSINENIRPYEAEIKANTKYALGVEEGTKPHIIKPKRGKFLYWKGAPHPVKLVNHPGGKSKPYLIPAFEKESPIFLKNLEELIKW